MERKGRYSKVVIVLITAVLTAILCFVAVKVGHGNTSNPTKDTTTTVAETEIEASSSAGLHIVHAVTVTSPSMPFSEEEVRIMAKVLHGEANCVESDAERAMVIWCILNRYDVKLYGDETIKDICRPGQFAYDADAPVTERNYDLVVDVIGRWAREKAGEKNVGRTLPAECLYFVADSDPATGIWHNAFYAYSEVVYGDKIWFGWEQPLENPYE